MTTSAYRVARTAEPATDSHSRRRHARPLAPAAIAIAATALLAGAQGALAARPLQGVLYVTGGFHHTCAVMEGGSVRCWGGNSFGQLGDGTTIERHVPTRASGLTGGLSGATKIDAGDYHTCAVRLNGTVLCWGANASGELGDGTFANRSTPVAVPGLSNVQEISAGGSHTCAVTGAGEAKCWGGNGTGQVGSGSANATVPSPSTVSGLTSGIATVSAGLAHTCALATGGAVLCWGDNTYGQLGDGTTTARSTPVAVQGLPAPANAVAAGANHTCAVLSDGSVMCWGRGDLGQLGNNAGANSGTPVYASGLFSGQFAIASGAHHSCARSTAGGVKCWGFNADGQLGNNNTANSLVPVSAIGGLLAPLSGQVILSAGQRHSCSTTQSGFLYCWGRNVNGQLGDGISGVVRTFARLASHAFGNAVDMNVDGHGDIVWQHADGRAALWQMNWNLLTSTLSPLATGEILPAGTGFSVSHIADFGSDGRTDILWSHADGRAAMWTMSGSTPTDMKQLLNAGSGWSAAKVADLDGDGQTDIVWQHTDGSVAAWLMSGTALIQGAGILGPGTGWSVTHVGDFDGDGKADLLWKHTDGRAAIWLMNGLVPAATAQILNAGSGWSVAHARDLDGDGKADLVWQHADGSVAVWLMNGAAMASGSGILGAGTGWSVAAVDDFDDDGRGDLFWQHTDGRAAIWLMNGLAPTATNQILNAGTGWSLRRTADFNRDRKADIVWQHADGSVAVWIMNGTSMASGSGILGPASGWSVSGASP